MDSATPDTPSSLTEWTRAVVNADLENIKRLHAQHPELLWVALRVEKNRFDSDYAHLIAQVRRFELLGDSLDGLAAIPFILLDLVEGDTSSSVAQQKCTQLLDYLIQHSRPEDLNSYTWGTCHNTLLHLVHFLGLSTVAQMLLDKGALPDAPNDLGCVASAIDKRSAPPKSKKSADALRRPNYTSPDRFKQLRQLAETQAAEKKASTSDTAAESLAKRQNSQEELQRKQQAKRQQDLALLTKRSAVKNNPLLKQFEQQSQSVTTPIQRSGTQSSLQVKDSSERSTRNSRVITSLRNKSIVSSSVFRQGEPETGRRSPSPFLSRSGTPSPIPSRSASPALLTEEERARSPAMPSTKVDTAPESTTSETLPGTTPVESSVPTSETPAVSDVTPVPESTLPEGAETNIQTETVSLSPDTQRDIQSDEKQTPIDTDEKQLVTAPESDLLEKQQALEDLPDPDPNANQMVLDSALPQKVVAADDENSRRWSGSQRSHWSAGINAMNRESILNKASRKSTYSETDSEQWYDSYDDWKRQSVKGLERQSRSISGIPNVPQKPEHGPLAATTSSTSSTATATATATATTTSTTDLATRDVSLVPRDPIEFSPAENEWLNEKIAVPDNDSASTTDDDTVRGVSLHADQQQAQDQPSSSDDASVTSSEHISSFSPHRVSAAAESIDTWPPPSSPVASEDDMEPKAYEEEGDVSEQASLATYGHVAVGSTSLYVSRRLPEQMNYENLLAPTTVNLDLPALQNVPKNSTMKAFGKLYIRVRAADGILLPIPKLMTYARCVVSDGHYEYMSRYEPLGSTTTFDYECIIDTQPDMIITVSIHVRPDVHVKPKTGLARLLTPVRKQREVLSGYVHPDDGAIGQSRFALDHMIHACYQKTFAGQYDCFNSWYARSSRERQRQTHEEVLKVVGSLSIEILYLPVSDPSLPVPGSLRECDLALRIRQWHDTCWQSGYLAIRRQNSQIWERFYCRLIGSRFICYASKEASSWKPLTQYDIADTIRLSAAADQVIVTLVDMPDNRVFQENPICEDTGRGFFRITFPDTYIDCVSDYAQESEDWVKILKSMIGRVPLKVPFSV